MLMPVIGRLDEQTEAVLITPLEKRDERKPGRAAQDERAPDAAEHPSHTKRRTPGDDESSPDKPARHNELPVWLL
jgi:hypothetical protein